MKTRLLTIVVAACACLGCEDGPASSTTGSQAGTAGGGATAGAGGAGADGGASSAGGSGEGGGPLDATAACAELAAATCGKLEECTPKFLPYLFGDITTCTDRMALDCTIRATLPGTSATPAGFSACAAAIDRALCDELVAVDLQLAACQPSAGELPDGQECDDHAQCTSAYCDTAPGICGVCMTRIPNGGDCLDAPFACELGLACAPGTWTCRPTGSEGDACNDDAPCDTSLRCLEDTCQEPLPSGAICSKSYDCDALSLLVCPDATGVCTELALAGANEACGDLPTGPTNCLGTSDCHTPSGDTGSCVPKAPDGAGCGADGIDCLEPAECVDDICKLPNEFTCN